MGVYWYVIAKTFGYENPKIKTYKYILHTRGGGENNNKKGAPYLVINYKYE